MDWDYVFAQMKRFYRCSKAEFKEMTLYETFQLLEDGGKLAEAESGEKTSKKTTGTTSNRDLGKIAQARGIRLPTKGL